MSEIEAAYLSGESTRALAARLGCHAATIWKRLNAAGVAMRPNTCGLAVRTYTSRPAAERFWEKVDKRGPDECWLWTGYINKTTGYGSILATSDPASRVGAHVLAFTLAGGVLEDGKEVDHLCRVRCCVNVAHLELVTYRENLLRGIGIVAVNAKKTHCKHGHEFTPENTMRKGNARICRECGRIACRARYRARSLAVKP